MLAKFLNDTSSFLNSVEVLNALPLPSAILTPDGLILYANEVYAQCWRSEVDIMVGRNIEEFSMSTKYVYLENVKTIQNYKRIDAYEYELFGLYYMVSLKGIFDANDELMYVLVCGSDITDIKSKENGLEKQNKVLRQLSEFDHLTGLMNRRAFDFNYLQCQNALIEKTLFHFALIVLDVDDFKLVNDQFGHALGDEVLVRFSQLLKQINQEASWKQVYRYGGEEFVILLPDYDLKQACYLAEDLRKAVEKLSATLLIQYGVQISISCGVVASDYLPLNSTYFEYADQAMYNAKQNNKNCVYYFDGQQYLVFTDE